MLTLFIVSCNLLLFSAATAVVPLQWGIYDSFKVAAGLPTTGAKVATPAK
jgi:hypothetical protein